MTLSNRAPEGLAPEHTKKHCIAVVKDRERHIPLFDAEKLLAKNGIDMYDNPVSPLSSGAELNGWSVDTHGREQVFLLKFRTARGAEFGEVTSWYSLKGF